MSRFLTSFQNAVKELLVVENFLPMGLMVVATFALSYPYPGAYCSSLKSGGIGVIEFINNIFVFLISGITLKIEELSDVIRNHKFTIIYGIATINFITTLLAFALIKIPFSTPEFAVGLTLFATVPTTLGVGVALTGISKGDQILSLFLTVSSNMLGIITVPFLLKIYLADQKESTARIDANTLALKLTYTVLIPTVVGMLTRHFITFIPTFTKQYRAELSMFSSSNLLMIVWMALSSSRSLLFQQSVEEIVYVFLVAIAMHLFYLGFNHLIAGPRLLNMSLKQRISVVIMASQKSSPVALAVVTNMQAARSSKGLFAVPCLIGQLTQIFIGSYIARQFCTMVMKEETLKAQERSEELGAHNPVPTDEPPQNAEDLKGTTNEEVVVETQNKEIELQVLEEGVMQSNIDIKGYEKVITEEEDEAENPVSVDSKEPVQMGIQLQMLPVTGTVVTL
jgi:sodium/bile acid cotransporter 7